MSFFHIPANCHGAISNGWCVQAFNTGIKGVSIAMQDQTLHTASSSSNIETFIVISSAIKAKVVVLHTKQQNQIASKAAPLGA